MGRIHLGARAQRGAHLLIPAVAIAIAIQAVAAAPRTAVAATPSSGIIAGSAPVAWDCAPVGGTNGDVDSFSLTVQLPAPAATFYAPDVRAGSAHAAVLTITQTWTGNDQTQALTMAATDAGGIAVGNATGAATNDGSDVSVFTLQDPSNATYTIAAENFDIFSANALASHAVATLRFYDLASQAQPAAPASGPSFDNYHIPLALMPPTPEETQVLGGRAFGEPSIGVDPRN